MFPSIDDSFAICRTIRDYCIMLVVHLTSGGDRLQAIVTPSRCNLTSLGRSQWVENGKSD